MVRGHAKKIAAFEAEVASLKDMIKDTSHRMEDTQAELQKERLMVKEIEVDSLSLRSQIIGLRAQLSTAATDGGRLRKDLATKDVELRDKASEVTNITVQLDTLWTYLAENGIVEGQDIPEKYTDNSNARATELEEQLIGRPHLQERAERDLQRVMQQKRDADSQVIALSEEIERLQLAFQSAADEAAETRATEAERKLEESETSYKARLQQLKEGR